MYAVHYMTDGHIDHIGAVSHRGNGFVTISVIDYLSLLLMTHWEPTGDEHSFPANECAFFKTKREALTEVAERNMNHHIS